MRPVHISDLAMVTDAFENPNCRLYETVVLNTRHWAMLLYSYQVTLCSLVYYLIQVSFSVGLV